MSQILDDLPLHLPPVALLQAVERTLPDQSRQGITWCQEAAQNNDAARLAVLGQQVDNLWRKDGDVLGRAVGFVWLAHWQLGLLPLSSWPRPVVHGTTPRSMLRKATTAARVHPPTRPQS